MKIQVVLPAYNEEEALRPLVADLARTLQEDRKPFEIVIVNDGSRDGTLPVAQGLAKTYPVRVLDNGVNRGLAETLKNGLVEALRSADENDVIIVMDADNTQPAGLMIRMLQLIREGNDVVIASRYREGSCVKGLSLFRRALSYGASWLFRIVFPIHGVKDYTCGFRAYRAGALMELRRRFGDAFISEKGFSCMVDLLLRLRGQDLVFTEVPMVLRYDRKPGQSKMRLARTIVQTLSLLVRRRLGIEARPLAK